MPTIAQSVINAGSFLTEHLRLIDPEIIRREYPDLWGYEGLYHNVKPGLEFGVRQIDNVGVLSAGRAVNYGGKATDIPLVSVSINKAGVQTLMGTLAAEWNWTELKEQETAEKSGFPGVIDIVEERRKALDQGLREWAHKRTLFGDPANGFQGMFNNGSVVSSYLTDNLYALPANQLHIYIKDKITAFRKATKGVSVATDILVNEDLWNVLTNPTNQIDGVTPYELLTNEAKGGTLRKIVHVNELSYNYLNDYGNGDPNWNFALESGLFGQSSTQLYDMFMLYDSTEDTLDKYSTGIYVTPPGLLDDQVTYRITGFIGQSEIRVKRPFKVKYYFYPTFTG